MTTESIEILSNLNQKISEGVYREVYRYNGFAVKKAKRNITKTLLFIKVRIPTSLYTLVKFAIRDLNEYEYKQYRSIISKTPPNLHMCFAKIHKPIESNKTSYSINQLVMNDDGRISQTLLDYGKVNDKQFWSTIDELEKLFLENHIYYFSIGGYNICVNSQADGRLIPVLVDYKRIGIRTFWHQLPLYFPYFMKLKMRRRFQRLREEFGDFNRVPLSRSTSPPSAC